jgi:hypothetical protein
MDIGFGEAMLIVGTLLAVTAALSGVMRGTVLSASVLSVTLGIVLAELDVVSVDVGDEGVLELIELALILPMLLLMFAAIVDFGLLFQRYLVVSNAAREGARIAVLPGVNYVVTGFGRHDLLCGIDATSRELLLTTLEAVRAVPGVWIGETWQHLDVVKRVYGAELP